MHLLHPAIDKGHSRNAIVVTNIVAFQLAPIAQQVAKTWIVFAIESVMMTKNSLFFVLNHDSDCLMTRSLWSLRR